MKLRIKIAAVVVAGTATLGLMAGPASADSHSKGYGKNFTEACGSTWGEIVANGQPRSESSAHYRMGYKGGVQGIMNDADALAFHAAALCG